MRLDFLQRKPEHLDPALVENSLPGLNVVVPRPERRSAQCQVQPLLTLSQRLFRFPPFGDVMDDRIKQLAILDIEWTGVNLNVSYLP